MGKRLAIYIKRFKNKEEHQYVYGTELDTFKADLLDAPAWASVDIYHDTIGRDMDATVLKAYHRMVNKALKKKIDVIATYSISLFGKNRDEALTNIQKLTEAGVELIFFHEKIKVPSPEGSAYVELLHKLTAAESVKHSVQTKKQVKKSFQKGKAHTPATYFLGYDTDQKGHLVINEAEAMVVRRIFHDFLSGKGTPAIAKALTQEKVKTARGNTHWTSNAVYKIIKQEKYYGAVKTQKSVTLEPHTHKRVINRENEPHYFIRDHHPAIISEETYLQAQRELKIRSEKRVKGEKGIMSTHSNTSPYSNIFSCGECGRPVIRRTLTSRKNGEKVHFKAWQCRVAAGREPALTCSAQYVWEEELSESVKEIFLNLKQNKNALIAEVKGSQQHPGVTKEEHDLLQTLLVKLEAIEHRLKDIAEATILGKDIAYEESLETLTAQREQINTEYERIKAKQYEAALSKSQLGILLDELDHFDDKKSDVDEIFKKTVQTGTLFNNHRLEIVFKCGLVRTFTAEKHR